MTTEIRAVVFDAVGTLMYADPPVVTAYRELGGRWGCVLSDAEIAGRFQRALARQDDADRESAWSTSESRERERWQSIVAEVFSECQDVEGLFLALWDHFADSRHWKLFPDVQACWQRLTEQGLTLAIGSNFDSRLESICRDHRLASPECIFTSSAIGWRKPSRQFFEAIERTLQIPPDELLFVGDSFDNDYEGTQTAGWHSVLVSRQQPPLSDANNVISSLEQLDSYNRKLRRC